MKSSIYLVSCLSAATLAALSGGVSAQDFPARTITFIVGASAGGPTDIYCREVAGRLPDLLGQQVVVENQPGPGGSLAARSVVAAEPDGHTLWCSGSSLPLFPIMYDDLGFDPQEDLVAVATIVSQPLVLLVNGTSEFETVEDLVAAAQEAPGQVTWGSAGVGGGTHLAGVLFAEGAGIDTLHIPYGGTAAALTDLLGDRITYMFNSPGTSIPQIEEGNVKGLAVTTNDRASSMPNTPTLSELGIENAEYRSWFGLFAPSGTPQDAIETLSEAVGTVVEGDDYRAVIEGMGVDAWYLDHAELDAFVTSETAKWRHLTENAGIQLRD